jgi:hypothetical protein
VSARPPFPDEPAEGFEYVAEVDPDWALKTGMPCRFTVGPGHRACCRPSVARLDRHNRRNRFWSYCADHLYGRWIEDGQVMHWVLCPIGEAQ